MKAYLTKRYRFCASHRLHNPALSAADNVRTYGKCNNPYGHGHNYTLEVMVSGPVNAATGMVCDLGTLDALVEREILDRFDHENLNTLEEFAGRVPTSENLAATIFNILQHHFTAAHLEQVKLHETSLNAFAYAGGAALRE